VVFLDHGTMGTVLAAPLWAAWCVWAMAMAFVPTNPAITDMAPVSILPSLLCDDQLRPCC
jgi:hypothetical protein